MTSRTAAIALVLDKASDDQRRQRPAHHHRLPLLRTHPRPVKESPMFKTAGRHDGYTTEPTHLRVFPQGDGTWGIDGADDHGNYTEACWTYDTQAEAFADLREFVTYQTTYRGVRFEWRDQRPTAATKAA